MKESCEIISLPIDTLNEICTTMKHAKAFITSRQKMHPTGIQLYNELLERLTNRSSGQKQTSAMTHACPTCTCFHAVNLNKIVLIDV